MISIIIPNKNSYDLLSTLLQGLYEETDFEPFEVIVVDNGSDDPEIWRLYKSYQENFANFFVHHHPDMFNFSRMVNRGFMHAKGSHYLLLNNDIEIIEPNWLNALFDCFSIPKTGIVGAKLLYPNDTIQHAGVAVGMNDTADHPFKGAPRHFPGPNDCLLKPRELTCVTGAVMLISKSCFDAVGLWDEENFAIAYNDVDYCLRARRAGFRVQWTPHAELYHHESASRKRLKSWRDQWRAYKERRALQKIHQTKNFNDPAFPIQKI